MLPIEYVNTIIGQYEKSEDGEKPAFKDEEDVPNDSRCATFCAAVGHIENERWAGIPFLLKAGKGRQIPIWRYCNFPVPTQLTFNASLSSQRIPDRNQNPLQILH